MSTPVELWTATSERGQSPLPPKRRTSAEGREYPNLYQIGPNAYAIPWTPLPGQLPPGVVSLKPPIPAIRPDDV